MNGLIALVGSGEYLPVMNEVDEYLLAHCGAQGRAPRVICLATAAGAEGEASWGRWLKMGEEHFRALGADVRGLPVIDRPSADDPLWAREVAGADLVYFSGGNPNYLFQTLKESRVWSAAQEAFERGAVYAGCSAGAMILSEGMPDFRRLGLGTREAFGILPLKFIMPHFDAVPAVWKPFLLAMRRGLKDGEAILGVDEETALAGTPGGSWRVLGRQTVSHFTRKEKRVLSAGDEIIL